jgi:endoglucanase
MMIDIGARSRQEAAARGVEILNPLAAVKDIAVLAANRVAGPSLSRKFGAMAMIEALKGYAAKPGKGVVFAWTTQSALANSGVARLARRFSPRQVLIVGAYQSTGGRTAKDPVETLDSGVLIPDGESPGAGSQLLKAALAAAAGKIKATASPTAAVPEARAFGSAADACAVGIPVLFPGTLVETIDLDDLQQLIEFIKVVATLQRD